MKQDIDPESGISFVIRNTGDRRVLCLEVADPSADARTQIPGVPLGIARFVLASFSPCTKNSEIQRSLGLFLDRLQLATGPLGNTP